ncbi:hypothetical protein [Mycetocola miduiensis]|uniref:Uncharacterized protein n=1 Tax=Mycetocola miduiensis TaxID=995034 RepID=A0A1I5AV97_9MICO|nr:hypothetical protein [Mycetocola miduiensis]SFN66355.1 hypothetical protein SAMN05216219_1562 [Mycetocola miduiensis]
MSAFDVLVFVIGAASLILAALGFPPVWARVSAWSSNNRAKWVRKLPDAPSTFRVLLRDGARSITLVNRSTHSVYALTYDVPGAMQQDVLAEKLRPKQSVDVPLKDSHVRVNWRVTSRAATNGLFGTRPLYQRTMGITIAGDSISFDPGSDWISQ